MEEALVAATAGASYGEEASLELRHLRYFVAVAEDLSFSRAAERLHIAQPSVSAQIKELERDLGVMLFERTSRAVHLTSSGQDILPLARSLLEDARKLNEQAQLSSRRLAGRLRIGFLADEYADAAGERVMAAMRAEHPRIAIEFQQVDFAEHHAALAEGQVDVAFMVGPIPSVFTSVPVGRSERRLAVSRMLLSEGAVDDLEHLLRGQTVVLPNQMTSHEWRRSWSPPDRPAGQIFVVGEDSMEAMLAAVGARRGVAVVPEYVSRFYPQPGVAFIPRADLAPCRVELAALASRATEPVVAAFLDVAAATTAGRRDAQGRCYRSS
jgi:DNA-binding transcriptional LysR family regulator